MNPDSDNNFFQPSTMNEQEIEETDIYQIPQFPLETWTNSLGFETLSIKDIAGLKAFARTRRSKMKDIVDIAEILHHEISLPQILDIAESQFGHDISKKEILTTLLELDDILANPMDEEIQYIHHRQYHRQLDIWIFGYLFREWSEADFPKLLYRFREIVPHSRNNKF